MTSLDYTWVLAISYGVAFAAWLIWYRAWPELWPDEGTPGKHAWRQLGWLLLSLLGVLGVGISYQRGWLIPRVPGVAPLTESLNQVLIFSPFLIMLVATRQSLASVWIRSDRVAIRVGIGLSLAAIAMLAFTLLHSDADSWITVVARVYHPKHLDWAVQVLLEDLMIAALFVRAAAAIGVKPAMILTGALFAAGHMPAMVANGEWLGAETLGLLRDATLVIVALAFLHRAADIWWMWMLHYAMDMMQKVSGAQLS